LADVAIPSRGDALHAGGGKNPYVVDQTRERDLVLRKSVTFGVDAHDI
jgi:hypothetical protein